MLRFVNYNIVFQEVPGEITLALNISGCPNRCKGCHSPYLMNNVGEELTEEILEYLLKKYKGGITCVGFMGGDAEPMEVQRLASWLKTKGVKIAWYSGRQFLPDNCKLCSFDYIKLGPYIEALGGLNQPTTNQRFYQIMDNEMVDITKVFYEKARCLS